MGDRDGRNVHLRPLPDTLYTPYVEIAGARRTDLPKDLAGAYRSNVLAHLWPWLAPPSVWGAFIAAEMALVGLALGLGSRL